MTAATPEAIQRGRGHFRVPKTGIQLWLTELPTSSADTASTPPVIDTQSLIRDWLGSILGQTLTPQDLARTPQGKPYLRHHPLQFNLSHTRDCLVMAWHDHPQPLGVDIERRDRAAAFAALARRYFHPGELRDWQQSPRHMQDETWLAIWTRKEAVLKAQGTGLRTDLKSIDTTQNPVLLQEPRQLFRRHTLLTDEHIISVAWPD